MFGNAPRVIVPPLRAKRPSMPRTRSVNQRSSEGQRILGLRQTMGVTQRELATAFGTTAGAIAQWEKGDRTVPGPVLKLIELYEAQIRPSEPPPSFEGEAVSWFLRNVGNARAVFFWALITGAHAFEDSVIARSVRTSAMRQLCRTLGELKGLSMKLGQMTGYMDLALPEEERRLLPAMQASAKAMPPSVVAEIVATELGHLPTDLFASWSPTPIAAASIGQVHAATLHDGREVAVKVQYPHIVEMLQADLKNVRLIERALTLLCPRQERGVWHEELRARLLEECDYLHEAKSQREFRARFAEHPGVVIPDVVESHSTERVLTTTFCDGVPLDVFVARASQAERNRAAEIIWDFHHTSLYEHHLFHADPHPGNYLFGEGCVFFLDFGRVKRFAPRVPRLFADMVKALLERDMPRFRQLFIDLGCVPDPGDFDFPYAFRMMLCVCSPYLQDEPFAFDQAFLERMWKMASRNTNHAKGNYPADLLFMDQLHFGLGSLFARLGATLSLRPRVLEYLYGDAPRPRPFSREEVDVLSA